MSYSEIIKQIKQWAGRDDFKRYLFMRMIARIAYLDVDSDGDVCGYNENTFDAIFYRDYLVAALKLAKKVYTAKGKYYDDYCELKNEFDLSRD